MLFADEMRSRVPPTGDEIADDGGAFAQHVAARALCRSTNDRRSATTGVGASCTEIPNDKLSSRRRKLRAAAMPSGAAHEGSRQGRSDVALRCLSHNLTTPEKAADRAGRLPVSTLWYRDSPFSHYFRGFGLKLMYLYPYLGQPPSCWARERPVKIHRLVLPTLRALSLAGAA